jgi:hypothetical protein
MNAKEFACRNLLAARVTLKKQEDRAALERLIPILGDIEAVLSRCEFVYEEQNYSSCWDVTRGSPI